jgi:hypothetical protein
MSKLEPIVALTRFVNVGPVGTFAIFATVDMGAPSFTPEGALFKPGATVVELFKEVRKHFGRPERVRIHRVHSFGLTSAQERSVHARLSPWCHATYQMIHLAKDERMATAGPMPADMFPKQEGREAAWRTWVTTIGILQDEARPRLTAYERLLGAE